MRLSKISKFLQTPLTVVIGFVWMGRRYSWATLASLVPIFVGVCMNNIYDFEASLTGCILAVLAGIGGCLLQVVLHDLGSLAHKMLAPL
jgi:drug/metabolite transporter (DMT)-like permease